MKWVLIYAQSWRKSSNMWKKNFQQGPSNKFLGPGKKKWLPSETHVEWWHPLMIKFFLYRRHQSSKGYETIRQSGLVSLPLQRILHDHSNAVKAVPGFSNEVDHQLKAAATASTSKEFENLVPFFGWNAHQGGPRLLQAWGDLSELG